jgi:hypothetical protein
MPRYRFRSKKQVPATSPEEVEQPYTSLDSTNPSTESNMSSEPDPPPMDTVFDTAPRPPTLGQPWPPIAATGNPQQEEDAVGEEERHIPPGTRRGLFKQGTARVNDDWDEHLVNPAPVQQPAPATLTLQRAAAAKAPQRLTMRATPHIHKLGYRSESGTLYRKQPATRPRREARRESQQLDGSALDEFNLRQQTQQTCTRPHFEETQKKPRKEGQIIKRPKQGSLEAVEEEPPYANVKDQSHRKSYQQPAQHRQRYTAALLSRRARAGDHTIVMSQVINGTTLPEKVQLLTCQIAGKHCQTVNL